MRAWIPKRSGGHSAPATPLSAPCLGRALGRTGPGRRCIEELRRAPRPSRATSDGVECTFDKKKFKSARAARTLPSSGRPGPLIRRETCFSSFVGRKHTSWTGGTPTRAAPARWPGGDSPPLRAVSPLSFEAGRGGDPSCLRLVHGGAARPAALKRTAMSKGGVRLRHNSLQRAPRMHGWGRNAKQGTRRRTAAPRRSSHDLSPIRNSHNAVAPF